MIYHILLAGFTGGIGMTMWAMIMNFIGFSKMNIIGYEGCMLTKQSHSTISFLMGMLMHFMLSLVIAFPYYYFLMFIWHGASWQHGAILGLAHWIIAGSMLPLMDKMNACVKDGRLTALGYFAYHYGTGAIITFLIGHVIYGSLIGLILNKL